MIEPGFQLSAQSMVYFEDYSEQEPITRATHLHKKTSYDFHVKGPSTACFYVTLKVKLIYNPMKLTKVFLFVCFLIDAKYFKMKL